MDLEEASASLSDPQTPAETTVTDKFAFAFDIDGVLIRGGRPIPEAVEAMRLGAVEPEVVVAMSLLRKHRAGGERSPPARLER